ncbi:hypothetical protein PR202_gb03592 [Eleusine coracana subsp. coracana]|uniref:SOSEKI DIX-like domain-containing protein n=1 Tax=Eleusine coracana subsp. coracana TaxID=191504 RepID=A0AAV5DZU5_ELECO|nr:hypothetical protein PR202_gb03592 [Eleusine coracana subsp. coracana]
MLCGKGMAAMYSWSSKRSYRNQGFVWHDLIEDDIIHPTAVAQQQGNNNNEEYVLKGSHCFSSSFLLFATHAHGHGRRSRNNHHYNSSSLQHQHAIAISSSSSLPLRKEENEVVAELEEEENVVEEILPLTSSSPDEALSTNVWIRASLILMQLVSCGIKSHSHSQHKSKMQMASSLSTSAHHHAIGGGHGEYFSGSLLIDETNNNNKEEQEHLISQEVILLQHRQRILSLVVPPLAVGQSWPRAPPWRPGLKLAHAYIGGGIELACACLGGRAELTRVHGCGARATPPLPWQREQTTIVMGERIEKEEDEGNFVFYMLD